MKKWLWYFTLAIGSLVLVASLLGIYNGVAYARETTNWAIQARGQDIGNLIAVVVLLTAGYKWRKGSKKAFLVWFGALFYFLYAYIIYAFAVHFNYLFLVYIAVLGLTVYALLGGGLIYLNEQKVVVDKRHRTLPAYTLVGTGILFALLWLAEIIPALLNGGDPTSLKDTGLWVNLVHVIDLSVVLPGMILAGISLNRGQGMSYKLVAPWLMFSVLMGASIIATMIIMTVAGYGGTIVPLVMVAVVVVMSALALNRYAKNIKI